MQLFQARVPSEMRYLNFRLTRSYHLLGHAYERAGDTALAVEAYRRVLTMWRDADRELPELAEVRMRLAQLEPVSPADAPISARP